MSWAASAWAKSVRTGSTSRKVVLLCLAERADSDTGTCFPAQATIADEAEVSTKTVERALADLQAGGLIARKIRRRADGSRSTDLITLIGFLASSFHKAPIEMPDLDASIAAESEAEQDQNTQADKLSGSGDMIPHQPDSVSDQPDTMSGLTTFEPSINREGLDAREDFENLINRCYAAAGPGLAPRREAGGLAMSERVVLRWIAQGANLEADVLPVIAALTGPGRNGRAIESWNYFTKAIEQAKAERLSPRPVADRASGKAGAKAASPAIIAAELGGELSADDPRRAVLGGLAALAAVTLSGAKPADEMRQTLQSYADRLAAYPPAIALDALEAWPAQRGTPAAKFFPSWAELKTLCDHRLAAERHRAAPSPAAAPPAPVKSAAVKAKFRSLVDELKGIKQTGDRRQSGAPSA